jgi:hypothetical protein
MLIYFFWFACGDLGSLEPSCLFGCLPSSSCLLCLGTVTFHCNDGGGVQQNYSRSLGQSVSSAWAWLLFSTRSKKKFGAVTHKGVYCGATWCGANIRP